MTADTLAGPPVETERPAAHALPETTVHDGCDRCGYQPPHHGLGAGTHISPAYGRAVSPDGKTELLFCGHHLVMYALSLIAAGWNIRDDRDRLYAAERAYTG